MEEITTTIIIAVPHAKCDEVNYPSSKGHHVCDHIAPRAASLLKSELSKFGYKIIGPIMGNINRMKVDLNRIESRDTDFRQDIWNHILSESTQGNQVVVLDIHSYDDRAPWVIDALAEGLPEPLLVFMDCDTYRNFYKTRDDKKHPVYVENGPTHPNAIPENLCTIFGKKFSRVASVSRSPVNDIVRVAKEMGAEKSVLIEFNESLLGDSSLFKNVVQHLAYSISQII